VAALRPYRAMTSLVAGPRQHDAQDAATSPSQPCRVDHRDFYANAVRAEPGVCWRMVSRGLGFRVDTPTDCPEPVR
jgi:hypothetical protein